MSSATANASRRRPVARLPVFRQLVGGDFAARLGYQICEFLFPLIAVIKLHSSGFLAGLVLASQFVPVVVLSIVAGISADRADTRHLMIISSVARGAALGLMGLLYGLWGLGIWLLVVAAMAVGSATVFYDVGFQSTIPRLLSPAELARGNGILQASTSATQMAGPALAGLLLQALGLPLMLAVTIALFAGAAVAFALIRMRPAAEPDEPRADPDGHTPRAAGQRSLLAGFRFTWRCRPVRDLCVQSGLFNLHEQAFITSFLLFGVRAEHLSAGVVGALVGVGSVGAVVGSMASGRLSSVLHAGAAATTGLLIASASFLVGPLLVTSWPAEIAFGVAFGINGLALGTYNVYAVSFRQAIPPWEYLGSVTASYRMVSLGLIPVGALLGGTLVDQLGGRNALLAIASSMTLASLLLLASPVKRIRSVEEAHAASR